MATVSLVKKIYVFCNYLNNRMLRILIPVRLSRMGFLFDCFLKKALYPQKGFQFLPKINMVYLGKKTRLIHRS